MNIVLIFRFKRN